MGDLLIRNVPESIRGRLNAMSREQERSVSELSKEALRRGLDVLSREHRTPTVWDAIRADFSDVLMTDEEFFEFQRALEEIRREPDRPPPDFE